MNSMIPALSFLDKHKGLALLLGGFVSATAGATWWLAKGGAVALTTSLTALANPQVAQTIQGLPAYHARVEQSLYNMSQAMIDLKAGQRQLQDALESYRGETEMIVDWAREHSQMLTDSVGGCYAGESCLVYFPGRRTQAGAACVMKQAKPRLLLPDGREFPVAFSEGFEPVQLTIEFETIPVNLDIPDFIDPGHVGVLVLNYYAECPFAPPGAVLERESFRLLVEIKRR